MIFRIGIFSRIIAPNPIKLFNCLRNRRHSKVCQTHKHAFPLLLANSSWLEIPCRRAVADDSRGAEKLSSTIRSFSAADHRRRRPVSTISSRLIWRVSVRSSIPTISYMPDNSARRPKPSGYGQLDFRGGDVAPLNRSKTTWSLVHGRKRYTEEQIIAILKEHEAGMKTADLCRRHGISEASFYNWKARYGGLEVSEAKRLRGLESENARLKKLLADAMLDNAALKDLLAKKW